MNFIANVRDLSLCSAACNALRCMQPVDVRLLMQHIGCGNLENTVTCGGCSSAEPASMRQLSSPGISRTAYESS